MRNSFSPTSRVLNPNLPAGSFAPLPAHLERKIAARWNQWAPWVRLEQLRRRDYAPAIAAAETTRLRGRHREHILAFTSAGIAMRLVRRHRLDDPRLTDDARAVLVRGVVERQRKARAKPRDNLATLINLAAFGPASLTREIAITDLPETEECPQPRLQAPRHVTDPQELQQTIASIRKRVSEQFHLAEIRDPDLTVRSHKQVFAFPRQLAMYIARQVTGASLEEIGRQFGGRHHSTVLHSIKKIEEMRQSDEDLNGAITRLMNALQQ